MQVGLDRRRYLRGLDFLAFLLVVGVGVVILVLLLVSRPTGVPGPSASPTLAPTGVPSVAPTTAPTGVPSVAPTAIPTAVPSAPPSVSPTSPPTAIPTAAPTSPPTAIPTAPPTRAPTAAPTAPPTAIPTAAPTSAPTSAPTAAPTTTDRYVFVTRGVYNGNLGGFDGSNATCRTEAALSNLTFIANSAYPWRSMLGTVIANNRKREVTVADTFPETRFTNPGVLYKLPSGVVISTSFSNFFSDAHDAPLLEDQYGVNGLGSNLLAWTGWILNNPSGIPDGYCNLWVDNTNLYVGAMGDLTQTGITWHEYDYRSCNTTLHLICVQD